MPRTLYYVLFFVVSSWLGSPPGCAQRPKPRKDDITYFQPAAGDSLHRAASLLPAFRIQPGTELNITVATLSGEIDALFNTRVLPSPGLANNPDTKQPAGYLVDATGSVTCPVIGRVSLLNLTTPEAADVLMARLSQQVNNPFVTVRIVNFQVTVFGEVNRPVVLNVSRERMTLPEALSLAGDLTIYGKRENVLIVRERLGSREFGRVDLQDRSVLQSPYYYLQPNDLVYVEPKRSRKAQSGRVFPFLPTIFSGASLLATIAFAVLR